MERFASPDPGLFRDWSPTQEFWNTRAMTPHQGPSVKFSLSPLGICLPHFPSHFMPRALVQHPLARTLDIIRTPEKQKHQNICLNKSDIGNTLKNTLGKEEFCWTFLYLFYGLVFILIAYQYQRIFYLFSVWSAIDCLSKRKEHSNLSHTRVFMTHPSLDLWVSKENSTQFWPYLPRDKIRSHRRAQPLQDLPTSPF